MHNKKIMRLLECFTSEDFKKFKKYVHSDYFNKSQSVRNLYDYIYKYKDDLNSKQLATDIVQENVFGAAIREETKEEDQVEEKLVKKMDNTITPLTKLIKYYFGQRHYEQSLYAPIRHQLAAYCDRKMSDQFHKATASIDKKLKANPEKAFSPSIVCSGAEYQLLFERYHFATYNNFVEKHSAKTLLYHSDQSLDRLYILQKLKNKLEMFFHQSIIGKTTYTANAIPADLLEAILEKPGESDFLIHFYSALLDFVQKEYNEAAFENLQEDFFDKNDQLPPKEREIILKYLINITVQHYEKEKIATPILAELHEWGIREGILIVDGFVTEDTFLNTVIAFLLNTSFDDAESFITEHTAKLKPEVQSDVVALAWAFYYFHKKEFEQSSQQLPNVKERSIRYTLRAYTLKIRTDYERYLANGNEGDFLEAMKREINNFSIYLDRSKTLSADKTLSYKNFSKMTRQIYNYHTRLKASAEEKNEMINFVESKPVTAREWLLDKISGLPT